MYSLIKSQRMNLILRGYKIKNWDHVLIEFLFHLPSVFFRRQYAKRSLDEDMKHLSTEMDTLIGIRNFFHVPDRIESLSLKRNQNNIASR